MRFISDLDRRLFARVAAGRLRGAHPLLPKLTELAHSGHIARLALVIDAREGVFLEATPRILNEMKRAGHQVEVLFLDSSDESLIRRFSTELNHTWTSQTFYVVIFRSQLKPDIDNDLLYKLDYESHREACESGGLLKYWFGKTDGERRNLATCEFVSEGKKWVSV